MISVVIPAYNEEHLIGNCLDSLVNQKTSRKFKVILADNSSTDKTTAIARTYRDKLNLKIISEKTKGRGAARKKGFDEAGGEIILSTDSDTVVPFDWIERLTTSLEGGGVVAVTGTCRIADCGKRTNRVFNLLQPQGMRVYKLITGHFWLSGFNFGIYRDIYNKSGGFDPSLNAQEDIELSFRVSKLGKIGFVSDLPVQFSGRRFRKGLIKGMLPYISTFLGIFIFRRKNEILSDIR